METGSSKKRLLRIVIGLVCLVLLALSVMYYFDKSWSDSLKNQDIIVRSQQDSLTGQRRDTSFYAPQLKP
jgi:hypothetical protein